MKYNEKIDEIVSKYIAKEINQSIVNLVKSFKRIGLDFTCYINSELNSDIIFEKLLKFISERADTKGLKDYAFKKMKSSDEYGSDNLDRDFYIAIENMKNKIFEKLFLKEK